MQSPRKLNDIHKVSKKKSYILHSAVCQQGIHPHGHGIQLQLK